MKMPNLRKIKNNLIYKYKILNDNLVTPKERFEWIYQTNLWNSSESRSGTGSTHQYAENAIINIKKIIDNYQIKKIFDAPCGDLNWMKKILEDCKFEYIGGDIAENLIIDLKKYEVKYPMAKFLQIDITQDSLPDADLMICRDCLFHLSELDINKFLDNFRKSRIEYLLTTTHVMDDSERNKDIITGDYRKLDLFKKPYNLKVNILNEFYDYIEPDPIRKMVLIRREDM